MEYLAWLGAVSLSFGLLLGGWEAFTTWVLWRRYGLTLKRRMLLQCFATGATAGLILGAMAGALTLPAWWPLDMS